MEGRAVMDPSSSKPERAAQEIGKARSVALRYIEGLPAPFLVAKGGGHASERLESLAERAGVPIVRDDALALALFPLDLGDYVPVEYFEIIARVFAFVKRIEET